MRHSRVSTLRHSCAWLRTSRPLPVLGTDRLYFLWICHSSVNLQDAFNLRNSSIASHLFSLLASQTPCFLLLLFLFFFHRDYCGGIRSHLISVSLPGTLLWVPLSSSYYGGVRLLRATVRKFHALALAAGVAPHRLEKNCTLSYDTNIPRMV